MSNKASDTLAIARSLKAAGIEAEKADAFVEAVARSTGKLVTVEHFDAAVEKLNIRMDGLDSRIDAVRTELLTRMDGLEVRIDAVRTEMQASIDTNRAELQASVSAGQATMTRFIVVVAGVIIAANALMIGILRFFPGDVAAM